MIPITPRDILTHQAVVPWSAQHHVEQDLLLCRAMIALFDYAFLSSQIATRGGTLLHKVHLAPPAPTTKTLIRLRSGSRPPEPIRCAMRRVLEDVLGAPKASIGDTKHRQTITSFADDLLDAIDH
jgi:hypothetical protein